MDPYVDFTGRVTGYVVVNIAELMGDYDWRLADKNVWKVERVLLDHPHRPLRSSDARVDSAARAIPRVPGLVSRGGSRCSIRDASAGRRCRRNFADGQSRSKSRIGLVTGSSFA